MDRKSAVRENTSQPSLWIVGKLKALTTTCASSDVPGLPSYPSTANVHASTTSLRPFRIVTSRLASASPASGAGSLPCATTALAIRVPCSDFAPEIASTPKSPANATRSPARGTRPSSPSAPLRAASRSEYGTGLTPSAMKYAIPADTSGYPSSPGRPVVALYVSIAAIGLARVRRVHDEEAQGSELALHRRRGMEAEVERVRRAREPDDRVLLDLPPGPGAQAHPARGEVEVLEVDVPVQGHGVLRPRAVLVHGEQGRGHPGGIPEECARDRELVEQLLAELERRLRAAGRLQRGGLPDPR